MVNRILCFLFLALCIQSYAQKQTAPNVIFILADDLGAGDLHCTGHPYAKTPHLDRLAQSGIQFDRAYMAAGWCAPSRAGLMSGKYPARYFYDSRHLNANEPVLTRILSQAGYTTMHVGKWHLTNKKDTSVTPERYGINKYFIPRGISKIESYPNELKNDEYQRAKTTDYFVDRAIELIGDNEKNSEKPFYLNLWIHPTHSYIKPTPEQLKVYEGLKVNYEDFSLHQQEFLKFVAKHGDIDEAMQAYCADITAMDKALGRLFTFLKQKGLTKETLIVFSSDNGPGPLTKQVNDGHVVKRYKEKPDLLNNVGSAKMYKERKLSLHEGGIRVPFIVSYPGMVPQNKKDETTIVHGVDWLPTIVSLCGANLPAGVYDGMDLKPAFLGKSIKRKEAVYWCEGGAASILMGQWKGYLSPDNEFELYDIIKDQAEMNNLKNENTKVADGLEQQLNEWLNTITN